MGGYDWGCTAEQDFIDAINYALDNGVNFFDTANTYGFGQSEETLAKGLGARRKDVVIQSKFGVRVMQDMVGRKTIYDNSPDYIRKALEGTLTRLKTDYIDIYTIHYRDSTPLEEVVGALEDLKKEGKIRFIGLSNIHGDGIEEFKEYKGSFATCQDEFSLACRKNEQDLRNAKEQLDVVPMTWGSLGQGILTGKYGADVKFGENDRRRRDVYVNFHGEKLKKNLEIVDAMRPIAEAHGKSLAATAIRFILDHLDDSIVIAGVKSVAQMKSNLEGLDWRLDEDELKILNEVSWE
ncbi:MAG: aldo/keto reductase [Clostridia bacterium]|nr:aldo/keto reductase [Clostridia bacterium]